jgi:hypothetical protein
VRAGSASLSSGELELMVHRRLMGDDGKGVGEPLDETEGITPYVRSAAVSAAYTPYSTRTLYFAGTPIPIASASVSSREGRTDCCWTPPAPLVRPVCRTCHTATCVCARVCVCVCVCV